AMWIRDHEPEIYQNTYKILNAKDYIVFRLTGKFYTDPSDANSMDCFDQKTLNWSDEILQAARIDRDKLPKIVPSTYCVGKVTPEAAAKTGLSTRTKVIMGAGDGVAANVGAGSISPGKAFCCLGTSAWVASTSEEPVLDEAMRIVCWAHAVPGLYSPNGTMQYACGSYSWFKNTIGTAEILEAKEQGISPYDVLNAKAEKAAPGANGTIFLPHLLGERAPRWNPYAKGAFLGLTASTTREELIRATLEGISLNLSVCLDALNKKKDIDAMTVIGGGAKGEAWCRILADIFEMPVKIPASLEEAGSMGAAVIAGVGAGIYENFDAVERFLKIRRTIEPDPDHSKIYRSAKLQFENYYHALEPFFTA
ncbi:MAG: xylulokinase, partial [Blautia sp.]|nr:xylulokinase [Blautia sp.]